MFFLFSSIPNLQIKNYSDNSSVAIKKISESTGAQIAIVGKARAAYFTTIQGTAMKSYRSDVAITAINISDYSTIARATHQTGGVGGSDKDAYSNSACKICKFNIGRFY